MQSPPPPQAEGFGFDFLQVTEPFRELAVTARNMEVLALFTLYMLDCEQWETTLGKFLRNGMLILVITSAVVFFVSGGMYNPYWLILLCTIGTPAWFILSKHVFFRKVVFRDYVAWLTGPLLATAVFCIVGWGYWISLHKLNDWNKITKVYYAEEELDWATFQVSERSERALIDEESSDEPREMAYRLLHPLLN